MSFLSPSMPPPPPPPTPPTDESAGIAERQLEREERREAEGRQQLAARIRAKSTKGRRTLLSRGRPTPELGIPGGLLGPTDYGREDTTRRRML